MLRSARNLLIAVLSLTLGIIIVAGVRYCNKEEPEVSQEEETAIWCGNSRRPMSSLDLDTAMSRSVSNGKMLFEDNCKSCHKVHEQSAGPGLHGVTSRRDREWIYKFVRNSKQLIESEDEYAVKLFEEYGKSEMTAFPDFSDKQIDDILNYIESEQIYR